MSPCVHRKIDRQICCYSTLVPPSCLVSHPPPQLSLEVNSFFLPQSCHTAHWWCHYPSQLQLRWGQSSRPTSALQPSAVEDGEQEEGEEKWPIPRAALLIPHHPTTLLLSSETLHGQVRLTLSTWWGSGRSRLEMLTGPVLMFVLLKQQTL